jgi:Uma2 family endonuclease
MSTIDRGSTVAVPPLVAGDRLDAATFRERYDAMPPSTRAELIDGVVYMPSPLMPDHGRESRGVVAWLGYYQARTPGVGGEDNTSTRLGPKGEVQPDHNLRIRPECGGQSGTAREFIVGAPELIVEVARSTRRSDLGIKKDQYERAGVREYLVVALDPDEIHWFVLRDGRFQRKSPGEDGYYRSQVFPGLWLDPAALFNEDLAGLVAVVDLGVATPEHAEFVARLEGARAGRTP